MSKGQILFLLVVVLVLIFIYFFWKGIDNGLIAIVVAIVHFFTGSTTGSQAKDATIASQLPQQPPTPQAEN